MKTKTERMSSDNTILTITFISMIIVIVVTFVFAMSLSRPIRRLTGIADTVSMGKLDEETERPYND
ncbi:MAG: hypothetical protein NTV68_06515 [Methanomicrobiales archaeon]|nr:hypothetical protein [Methanomicrobiales archaeon]